ncbi:MAG: amino acid ABC transporter permease [Clostridiales bacterium]|nr:amino acid ABC transporter permease [Clostridiales bacterium]
MYLYQLSIGDWWNDLRDTFTLNFIDDDRYMLLVKGLGNTFLVTLGATILGILLGVIVALVRSTYDKTALGMRPGAGKVVLSLLNKIASLYLTVIRGTPVLVQLMIAYFVIFVSIAQHKTIVAIIAFGINSGAYVAEIIRSGIMSIDPGQFEAGRSLGFNYAQTMLYIIIPQALKNVLPALANEFIVLIKETSVSCYIGLHDLTKGGEIIRSRTYTAFMPLLAVALIYLVIVMFFTRLVNILERRLRNSER